MAAGAETDQLFGVVDVRLLFEVGVREAADVHQDVGGGGLSGECVRHRCSFGSQVTRTGRGGNADHAFQSVVAGFASAAVVPVWSSATTVSTW